MDPLKPTINEAIDSCRPGSDDLSLPELGELADVVARDADRQAMLDRSLAWDSRIANAIQQEVSVPTDLAERLLAGIESGLEPASSSDSNCLDECVQAVLPQSGTDHETESDIETNVEPRNVTRQVDRSPGKRSPRLRWFAMATGLAACICVAVFAAVAIMPGKVDVDTLLQQVRDWVIDVRGQSWNQDLDSAPIDSYPLDSSILVQPTGWQEFRTPYDGKAVAYDLRTNAGQPFAALIVVKTTAEFDVQSHLPMTPHSDTGQLCIGACQKNGYLYILIIEGNQRTYQRVIKAPPPVM